MPVSLPWAVLRSNAIAVASTTGASSHATVFGYEAGAQLATRTAPARRVGWLGGDSTQFNSLNNAAWATFDAAVRWASGR